MEFASPTISSPGNVVAVVSLERVYRWMPWIALVIILLFSGWVRLRLAPSPLERDEGEYAYAGQLLLQHIPPYRIAYNMKFPGTYFAYAIILGTLGKTTYAIHVGTMLVNAADTILVFLLARRLWGGGTAAAAVFALMSMDEWSLGMAGHATHFVVLAALSGLLILVSPSRTKAWWRCFIGAVCLGVAVLMKQSAAPFVLVGYAWWIGTEYFAGGNWRRIIAGSFVFAAGVALAPVLTGLWLYHEDVFGRFWYWTIDYARFYGTEQSLGDAPLNLWTVGRHVLQDSWPLWLLGGLGLIAGWFDRAKWRSMLKLTFLAVFSFAAMSAGFYFREHYFIMFMPAVAIGVSALGSSLRVVLKFRSPLRMVFPLLVLTAVGIFLSGEREFLFEMTPQEACLNTYSASPFLEAVEVSKYLQEHSAADASVAVLGSEPEIFFESNLHSATGYILTYALMEPQPFAVSMQHEMAREITAAQPEYVVDVHSYWSWLVRDDSARWIFDWQKAYLKDYAVVGAVFISEDKIQYFWGADAARVVGRRAAEWRGLLVYRRQDSKQSST